MHASHGYTAENIEDRGSISKSGFGTFCMINLMNSQRVNKQYAGLIDQQDFSHYKFISDAKEHNSARKLALVMEIESGFSINVSFLRNVFDLFLLDIKDRDVIVWPSKYKAQCPSFRLLFFFQFWIKDAFFYSTKVLFQMKTYSQ